MSSLCCLPLVETTVANGLLTNLDDPDDEAGGPGTILLCTANSNTLKPMVPKLFADCGLEFNEKEVMERVNLNEVLVNKEGRDEIIN